MREKIKYKIIDNINIFLNKYRKIKRGYKLVRRNIIFHDFISHVEDFFKVTYNKKIWTRPLPNCGPLCVFESYNNTADLFDYNDAIIFKCKYIKSKQQEKIWTPYHITTIERLPEGTILADKVMITKMMKKD